MFLLWSWGKKFWRSLWMFLEKFYNKMKGLQLFYLIDGLKSKILGVILLIQEEINGVKVNWFSQPLPILINLSIDRIFLPEHLGFLFDGGFAPGLATFPCAKTFARRRSAVLRPQRIEVFGYDHKSVGLLYGHKKRCSLRKHLFQNILEINYFSRITTRRLRPSFTPSAVFTCV